MQAVTTECWNCNSKYKIILAICPKCCASNANVDTASALLEKKDPEKHIDHDWIDRDESFDHEYGTESVRYQECSNCGKTRNYD